MITGSKDKGCWVQCSHCGYVYWIEEEVPIDKLYITSVCARCGHDRGLNCGDKKEDIYVYCDPYLNERYYQY